MKFIIRVKNKLLCEFYKIQGFVNTKIANRVFSTPNVKSIDETLDKLLSGRVSMSRFGDGEYKLMVGYGNGFQKADNVLSKRLREIVKLNGQNEDYIVCIPNAPNGYGLLTDDAYSFWKIFILNNGFRWYKMLNIKNEYYNAHVTRLYIDWKDKDLCAQWFKKIRKVWNKQNVIIVEGEKSRLGIGNDLFDNAASIRRIIAPSNNAFEKYNTVLNEVKKFSNDCLILIALGQTATVLAYDLYKAGYHALDIGHIDIEYEWFLKQAKDKVAIPGKYIKEIQSVNEVEEIHNDEYESQIIGRVL